MTALVTICFHFGDSSLLLIFITTFQYNFHSVGIRSTYLLHISIYFWYLEKPYASYDSLPYFVYRWVANYHEHETLLQENEEEKLSKEEQDMAWEVFQKSLEWEEVQRGAVDESTSERKPAATSNVVPPTPETSDVTQPRSILRSRVIRKCTNLSHLLTLRSQGTKFGCSTVCGECAQEIRWEDLKKDGKSSR